LTSALDVVSLTPRPLYPQHVITSGRMVVEWYLRFGWNWRKPTNNFIFRYFSPNIWHDHRIFRIML